MNKKIMKKRDDISEFCKALDYSETPALLDLIEKHCLFFDSELRVAHKLVKELSDIFKRVYKRFERRETLQITASVARYMELDNEIQHYPHLLYDFKCRDVRICICKIRGIYHILCLNFRPSFSATRLKPDFDDDRIFGCWNEFNDDLLTKWLDCVFDFSSKNLGVLF